MDRSAPHTLPERHKAFLETSVSKLKEDPRITGLAAGGSFLLDEMDEFSDLDLVVFVSDQHYSDLMEQRKTIAAQLGPLLESFTGEHVGEPRLLVCLYGPPLLHIDLKFVAMADIQIKVENPVVLWERDQQISSQLMKTEAVFPQPDSHWIEKRFWTWVHYIATKIGRGELFEAVEAIGFLRTVVLGPLLLAKHGARPQGLRKIEDHATTEELQALKASLSDGTALGSLNGLQAAIKLYQKLRPRAENPGLEKLALEYLAQIQLNTSKQQRGRENEDKL